MNLRDLERMVYRRTNKNVSTPNAETQDRIRGFINERHRDVLTDFPQLRDDTIAFDSVANQQDYAIAEHGIARINRIWETTNDRQLDMRSLSWLRATDPDPSTGTPDTWIPMSYTQVHTQPSNASEIFVDSTSASDVYRCYVEGWRTGGIRASVEVTMTGTTAVSISSAITDWVQIDKFFLSQAAVGTVTLHEDASGGTELSKIGIGDTYAKYLAFLLYPTPSAVVTYTCDVTRSISDMVNPTDEPLLPLDFHQMLAIGARLDEYEHSDDARRAIAEVEWDRWHKRLTSWIVAHPSVRIDLNAEGGAGRSRLGAWYPSGS
jgi:hypothetical protein